MGRVIVARRSAAVDGLGHVGWAYEQSDGTWMCGATENPRSSVGASGDGKGFWTEPYEPGEVPGIFGMTRILPAGVCPPYDVYKSLDTPRGGTLDAWSTACWCRDQPFIVPCRDCLDDCFDILTSYGAELPWPILAIPNLWFDCIKAPATPVPLARGRELPSGKRRTGEGSMPIWRSLETTEGIELRYLEEKYAYLRNCVAQRR